MVLRPRNAGLVEYRGEIVIGDDGEPVKATSPALVDRDLWETACAVLTDPARKTSTGNKPTRLLSGIARCWCGAPVRAGGVRGGVAVYRCADSEHLKRRVDLVDGVVVEHILAVLRREKVAHRGPTGPTPGVREKTDALRKRIAQVEDALVGDPTDDLKEVSQAGLRRNLVRLRAQLADMERHEALDRVPGAAEGVTAENFPTLPFERRRAVVAYFVTVRLLKTRPGRFDPDSVEVRSARRP